MTAITGSVKDVTGVEDNETPWSFASVIRFAEDGSVITEKPREVRAVSGNLKVNLVPGYAIVTYGKHVWQVTVPETPTSLKALIEAGVAYPPDTPQALLDAAVGQYVETHREQFRTRGVPVVGDPTMAQWVDENGLEIGDPVPWSQVISEQVAYAAAEAQTPAAAEAFWALQAPQVVAGTEPDTVRQKFGDTYGPNFPAVMGLWEGIAGKPIFHVTDAPWSAANDGVTDDTAAINAALTWIGNNGGGVLVLGRDHLVSGTLVVPECSTLRGRGGHSGTRGTEITSSATSGAVVHLSGRTARLEHVRILSTSGRRAASTTTGHGVFIGGTDVAQASYPFFTRVGLFDVDIQDQPTDGVHGIGTLEMGHLNTVTVSDCVRHGFVLDGGGIAGWTNAQLGPFMLTLTACRAIECGGQALICLTTSGLAPQGLQLDFEALGCAWDSTKRNTISGVADTALHQIQIGGRGHIFHRLDVEDQQYAASTTTTGGHARTALSVPSKGVYNLASGVVVNLPFFSSLEKSWTQGGSTSGLEIKYPTIFPGNYATLQAPAIQVPNSANGVDVRYLTAMCTGASTVLTNQSVNARIEADGVPRTGTASSTILGWADGLAPTAVTLASDILTTTSRRTIVGGQGAAADNLHTIRIASGNNGYQGMEITLFRGSEDITIKHGAVNILNASGADIVMTATTNTVLRYVYNGTNWVQTQDKNPSGSATLDFGSVSAQSFADLTISVSGAAVGDCVSLGVPTVAVTAGIAYTAWVSAANTVTVRAHNYTGGALDPASGTFKATIVR